MLTESWVEGKSVKEKDAEPTERTAALWGLSSKINSRIWVNFTRNGLRLSQGIKSTTHRRVEESGYSCHQRSLTWAKRRRTGLLPSGPKSSFQMRISFVFHLEIKVLESGGRVEKLIARCLKSSVKFPQSDDLGCNVICWCWSIVFFENQRHCTCLSRHFWSTSCFLLLTSLLKDADLILQQDLSPSHTAKSTKSWLNDHDVGVLDWPANSPDLNPIVNLGFHTTSAVPQTDHLHATPNWGSN